jgi:soluble lytic murein transglycosylase
MNPPTASYVTRREASRRASARRRQVAARRRRALLVTLGVGVLIVAVVLALPLFRKAVKEFTLPLHHQDIIRQQAAEKHLDPALIAAVIYAETKFDPRPSSAGAQGLMQILPQTAEFLAHRSGAKTFTTADLATPQVNIAYGSYYLRYLLDEYSGRIVPALAAYNGGEANVSRWLAAARARGHHFSSRDIPFPETRAYVQKVLQAQRDYRHSYATELGYR